jgi:hypothetical protein
LSYSLHGALVPSYLQILRGASLWLDKGAAFGLASGKTEAEMMAGRLAPDMLPFNRQVRGFAMHAQGGIEGAINGVFSPDRSPAPTTFAGLKDRLAEAIAFLEALDPQTLDELVGKPMTVDLGETKMSFTADNFLFSFSQPNFYFHATTAYAILRNTGAELGKMDYLAHLRVTA